MKKKRIADAIKDLGITRKDMYTAKELNDIAKEAKCNVLDVMHYLRYGK
ncbi:MAG: hypothetical protein IJV14_14540 [Lachnospiraceae bacterium]|nr:hypothetical protein [Lachnospiraceae bacterium]